MSASQLQIMGNFLYVYIMSSPIYESVGYLAWMQTCKD